MTEYLRVVKWEKFQHYKERNPPWIKLHVSVMEKYEWEQLSDIGKGHLVALWMLASRTNNRIAKDANWIMRKCSLKSKINLEELISLGFIEMYQDASDLLSPCLQNATLVEESRDREEESKVEPDTPEMFEFENVRMTMDEKEKLIARFGRETARALVERFNNYSYSKPKKFREYVDHYRTLLNWGADLPRADGGGNSRDEIERAKRRTASKAADEKSGFKP